MRKRIYEIIEIGEDGDILSKVYDFVMMFVITISIIPLAFKTQNKLFLYIDKISCAIFIMDYALRLITSDFKMKKHGTLSFVLYPFTPMALFDILSILPSITVLNNGFRLFKLLRFAKTLRIFRVFKAFRYSKSIILIMNVFRKQKDPLLAMCWIAAGYILISALVIFNVEPQSFNTFFDAIYWATVSLTTVGYGDIYPVTTIGRIITMISSIFGIAIIAMPAGIITAGIMEEINKNN